MSSNSLYDLSRDSVDMVPRYLEWGPKRLSISWELNLNTSSAPPKWEIRAKAILGSNPNILFNAQWHAFSCVIIMMAK